jgi:dipeptidyl aminopeptidase/acylaminoacyl peptidase
VRRRGGDPFRDLRAPGEGDARRRAWEVASAALEDRRARRSRVRRPLLGAAAAVAVLLAAVSPPGSAVADWVGDAVRSVVDDDRTPARASGLDELPGGGRVLVLAGGVPWIAGDAGHRRLPGPADAATWSKAGRFVALARGREVVAVDLRGQRRWTVAAPGPVHAVRWSPDGFRVAYAAGAELRVVAGDGTGDRRVALRRGDGATSAFPSFAWRPGAGHVLAFADRRTVFVADLDARRVLWHRPLAGATVAFSPDGRRLLASGHRELRVLDARDGRTLARRRTARLIDETWDRSGRRFALVRRTGARAEVLIGRPDGRAIRLRRLFAAGSLRLAGFSPDGRWLLVDWDETGTWLFLPVGGGRARQIAAVDGRFGAEDAVPVGWCCPP